jgi:hypothetical protein
VRIPSREYYIPIARAKSDIQSGESNPSELKLIESGSIKVIVNDYFSLQFL